MILLQRFALFCQIPYYCYISFRAYWFYSYNTGCFLTFYIVHFTLVRVLLSLQQQWQFNVYIKYRISRFLATYLISKCQLNAKVCMLRYQLQSRSQIYDENINNSFHELSLSVDKQLKNVNFDRLICKDPQGLRDHFSIILRDLLKSFFCGCLVTSR